MAQKKTNYSITVRTSISSARHFITQRECADWLGIKAADKYAIQCRCNKLGYTVEFD